MSYTESSPIVVGIGEILFDCLPDGKRLGGAPFNFSRFAQHCGMTAVPVSAVGGDADGDQVKELLRRLDITSRLVVRTTDAPTGLVNVELREGGVPQYTIAEPAAWDFLRPCTDLQTISRKAAAVCFGTLAQRNAVSRKTIREFVNSLRPDCMRILDLNLRAPFYDREVIEESLKCCSILKVSAEEMPEMLRLLELDETRWMENLLRAYRLQAIVFTRGEAGATFFDRHRRFDVPAVNFGPVRNTVGCGDAFTAAFVASRLRGEGYREAMTTAAQMAGKVAAGMLDAL